MMAVISHDAGGAEILSSYVRQEELPCLFSLTGPALKIFERKLGTLENLPMEVAINESSTILCGTSWQSDIEFRAIKYSRQLERKSTVFLDHWVNYKERFSRNGETCLPDEIWVGDSVAEMIAKKNFPGTKTLLVDNPYFSDIRREFSRHQERNIEKDSAISILYICEPTSEHALLRHGNAHFWGYTEEDALRYFISNLATFTQKIERIIIRPHPSERQGKYDWVRREYASLIEFGGVRTLFEEIAESDVIVGCESMAMVVGLLAGKKVISCIPPGGRDCLLPHPEIIKLHNILESVR
jgi:hypothetical protein